MSKNTKILSFFLLCVWLIISPAICYISFFNANTVVFIVNLIQVVLGVILTVLYIFTDSAKYVLTDSAKYVLTDVSMEYTKPSLQKGKAFNITISIWLILYFVVIIYSMMTGQGMILPLLLGGFFSAMGATYLITAKKKNGVGWIFEIIGIICVIFSAMYIYSSLEARVYLLEKVLPILISFLLVGFGILQLLWFKLYEKEMLKKCTYEIQGKCIELDKKWDSDSGTSYAPTFEYYIDNTRYEYKVDYYSGQAPNIGDFETLYVNPNDCNEVYRKYPKILIRTLYFLVILGVLITIFQLKDVINIF